MTFNFINIFAYSMRQMKPVSLFYSGSWMLLLSTQGLPVMAQMPQKKVVIIAVDGTPDYRCDRFLINGGLKSNGVFATMEKLGAYAGAVLPVYA